MPMAYQIAELAADEDYRGFHGPDSEGISVWVSAKLAPYHRVSEMLRG